MKFGFWFDYDHAYTMVKVFNVIKRRMPDAQASGFVISDRYMGYAVENLPAGTPLISFYDLLAKVRSYRPTAEEFAEFRAFDERHRLSRIAYSERHLPIWSYDELIPQYIGMIKAFREYVEREKPDVFVFDAVAAMHVHLFYCVLKDMGVKTLMPFQWGIDDLNYLCDNPYWQCPEVWALFNAMQEGSEAPTPAEREWAERYMARIRGGQPAYVNRAVGLEQRKFALPKLGRYVAYLRNYFGHDRNDPYQFSPLWRVWTILRLRINRTLGRRYLRDASNLGEFVLFPLHFEPEVATLVLSQYDQLSVIDVIIRQLPLGCRLVAKEHPAMAGQRDWRFYRDTLRRYPNLVFVSAEISLNTLVRRARALVTFNGTAILETMILQRPVVFTSRARFGGFGLGVYMDNFMAFYELLVEAERKIPSDRDLVNLLATIRRNAHGFEIMEPLGLPQTLHDDNIAKISAALLTKLKAA